MSRTINLEFSGIEYVNAKGQKAKADIRHMDAKEVFVASQARNRQTTEVSSDVKRVYRVSKLGERLIGRFYGSNSAADARLFAEQANAVYNVRRFYRAEVR